MSDLPRFTMDDQRAFAALSGDHNPMHVDEIAARRLLFGAPVVHGIHLVCRALEAFAATGQGPLGLAELEAVFKTPVLVDAPVSLTMEPTEEGAEIEISSAGQTAALITLRLRDDPAPVTPEPEDTAASDPDPLPAPLTAEEIGQAEGAVPLRVERARLSGMFPALAARVPAGEIAAILASTRIVGMECPGLHSLYSELVITFGEADGSAAAPAPLDWRCSFYHPDLRLTEIEAEAPGVEARITAFMRPETTRQITAREARDRVAPGRWTAWRALVVGGSRGLGEAAAKLLAAGGADVTLTYARGQSDAEAVASEIVAAGGTARAVHLDVTDPGARLPEGSFTHLFYFAAPKIRQGISGGLDPELYSLYTGFFVEGLARLTAGLDGAATVFNPSTIFVEEVEPQFAEYAAAKAASETFGRYAAAARPDLTFVAPRLPRLRTDQNASLSGRQSADPAEVLAEAFAALPV